MLSVCRLMSSQTSGASAILKVLPRAWPLKTPPVERDAPKAGIDSLGLAITTSTLQLIVNKKN